MANFDPSTLAPSAVRPDNSITLEGMGHATGYPGLAYEQLMQYLTQPRHDAGPDARRAMAHMFAGPKSVPDDVTMQQAPAGQALMSLLFGGGGR